MEAEAGEIVQSASGSLGLQQRLNHIAQAMDQAIVIAQELERGAEGDAIRWLLGLREALNRAQLECAEAQFCARELHDVLPPPDAIQPRLL